MELSSKKVETLVKKKKLGVTVYKDKRKRLRSFKFVGPDRNNVRYRIGSIPAEPSHYKHTRSETEYLGADLNLNRTHTHTHIHTLSKTCTLTIKLIIHFTRLFFKLILQI